MLNKMWVKNQNLAMIGKDLKLMHFIQIAQHLEGRIKNNLKFNNSNILDLKNKNKKSLKLEIINQVRIKNKN